MTDKERVDHILEAIERIEKFISGFSEDDFLRDDLVKYACY